MKRECPYCKIRTTLRKLSDGRILCSECLNNFSEKEMEMRKK